MRRKWCKKISETLSRTLKEKVRESTVMVIKENENLVRETVDKKKCVLVFEMRG